MIQQQFDKGILRLKLNRPDVHNAFDPQLIEKLTEAFVQAEGRSDVKVVWLEGNGPSFCSGADLGWMKSMAKFTFEENQKDAETLFGLFDAGARLSKPLLGKAHGNVMAGGLGLIAVCDIVAAVEGTKFCFSEVKLGLVPSVISPFVLRKAQGGRVRRYLLSGEVFGEKEALDLGLVHLTGTAEKVEGQLQNLAKQFCLVGPQAVAATKKLLAFQETVAWKNVRQETTRVIAERRVSEEGQEGLASFFEKRKPSWRA